MDNLKFFLKALNVFGYPSASIESIAKQCSYDLDNFLEDLTEYLGQDGTQKFCDEAIKKLEDPSLGGIWVDLRDSQYIVVKLTVYYYDKDDEDNQDYMPVSIKYIDSRFEYYYSDGESTYGNIKQMEEDLYDSDFEGYMALKEYAISKLRTYVKKRCGFKIYDVNYTPP